MRRAQLALQQPASVRAAKPTRPQPARCRERFTTKARRGLGLLETKGAAILLLFAAAVGCSILHVLGVPNADKFVTASLAALLYALVRIIHVAGDGALLSALLGFLGRKEKK